VRDFRIRADFSFQNWFEERKLKMKQSGVTDTESMALAHGQICPRCHVAIGVSEHDMIRLDGRVWHGSCFDRLSIPSEAVSVINKVLISLVLALPRGPYRRQLLVMKMRFRKEAVKHQSPTGAARCHVAAMLRKFEEMEALYEGVKNTVVAKLLTDASVAFKTISAQYFPNRCLTVPPPRWSGLAVGKSGMFFDQRDGDRVRSVA
jgi:hypothetical protein